MLLFQQPASHPSTQQQCRIQSTKQAMAKYAHTLDCGWSSTITKCTLMFSIPQAIWRDPFPFPAAVSKQASKLESGAGLGERLVTVSRDLPEAPLVPALRGGVRVERHGAEIAAASFRRRPSARGPARPPGRLLVSELEQKRRRQVHDGDDEEAVVGSKAGARDCRVRVREAGSNGEGESPFSKEVVVCHRPMKLPGCPARALDRDQGQRGRVFLLEVPSVTCGV
jgi:hypothetical protein